MDCPNQIGQHRRLNWVHWTRTRSAALPSASAPWGAAAVPLWQSLRRIRGPANVRLMRVPDAGHTRSSALARGPAPAIGQRNGSAFSHNQDPEQKSSFATVIEISPNPAACRIVEMTPIGGEQGSTFTGGMRPRDETSWVLHRILFYRSRADRICNRSPKE